MVNIVLLRRTALFLSFLVSGGWLLFPRPPITVLIVVVCLVAGLLKKGLDRRILPVVLLSLLVVLEMVFRPSGLRIESLASKITLFLAAILLVNLYIGEERTTLARDLYPMLIFMALQALATFAIANTVPGLFATTVVEDVPQYHILYILHYHITPLTALYGITKDPFIRPDGFFWEPGIYQMYLNLLLYLALFVFKNGKHALLALAAVVTTWSTTGMAIAVILLTVYFGRTLGSVGVQQKLTKMALRRLVSVAVIGVIAAVPVGYVAYNNVVAKFSGSAQGSALVRGQDLYIGINVAIANPLIGIGFDADQYLDAARRLEYGNPILAASATFKRTSSSGILYLLFSMGLPLAIPFLIGLARPRIFPHPALAGTVVFLTQISEPFSLSPFILLLIFSGLRSGWQLRQSVPKIAAGAQNPVKSGGIIER